jgi:hypothetical protein
MYAMAYHYSQHDTIVLALSNILIDSDHLIYFLASQKTLSIKKMADWGKDKYRNHQPFFYIFHTIEFLSLITFLGIILNNSLLKLISTGFALHLLCDSLVYFRYYRSYRPWLKYFFPSYIYIFNRSH